MAPIQLSSQASSNASGRQDAAIDFSGKTINFGGSGTLSQLMPYVLVAVVAFMFIHHRKKG